MKPKLPFTFYVPFTAHIISTNIKKKPAKLIIGDTLFTDAKHSEGKVRPKLTDAVFSKEVRNAEITFLKLIPIVCLLLNVLSFCAHKDISKGKCEEQSQKW